MPPRDPLLQLLRADGRFSGDLEVAADRLLAEYRDGGGLRYVELAERLACLAGQVPGPVTAGLALVLGARLTLVEISAEEGRAYAASTASMLVSMAEATRTAMTPGQATHWAHRLLRVVPVMESEVLVRGKPLWIARNDALPEVEGLGTTRQAALFSLWANLMSALEQRSSEGLEVPEDLRGLEALDEEFNRWRAEQLGTAAAPGG